jgi:DNA-binding PadR family transcriptional regulator
MVYRCLDVLQDQGLVEGTAGTLDRDGRGKTVLRTTALGRRSLLRWLDQPVPRLRDVRTDLLMKLLLLDVVGRDRSSLIRGQQAMVQQRRNELEAELATSTRVDPVTVWRAETAAALERTLARLPTS